jgi:DNA repair protein RadC
LRVEQLAVLALNPRSRVIGPPVIVSRGDTDGTDAPVRAILRAVLVQEASSFIIGHNHPSGDPSPSAGDRSVTKRLALAGRAIDCPCVDHIVVGPTSFVSLRREDPGLFS